MVTERGVWVPEISLEAMWFGISQWFGIADDELLSVLPNLENFGCNIFAEVDLYESGAIGTRPGFCGGDVVDLQQDFTVPQGKIAT